MEIFIDVNDDRSEKVSYDNAEYPIHMRRSCLNSYPGYAAPPHWHDDIEFIVILKGSMTYNVNGELTELNPQEGIFVNSRQVHFGYSETSENCEFICVLLHPVTLCLTPDMERNYVIPLLQNADLPFIHLKNAAWHQDIVAGVQKMYALKTASGASLKIQSIFTWIWALIYEHMPKSHGTERKHRHDLPILKNMIDFIQQHYREQITLEQIAASGGIGQSKCCKLFSTCIHQTPNAYLTGYRLHRSAELLQMTDLNITEIAYEVGFNGASYYAETFRKYMGISPSSYRKSRTGNKKETGKESVNHEAVSGSEG